MPHKILFRISFPIIIVGIFVIFVFIGLDYENLNVEIYAVFAIVAIFVFLFGFAIGQRLASPMRQLLEKAEKLSQGELSSRIYLETRDEFEELARAFNRIAEELEKSHAAVKTAENVADVKIRAKTQELEEEINNLEEKVKIRSQEIEKMIEESEKLREVAKNREAEIVALKKELIDFKEGSQKKGGTRKAKKS